MKKIILPIVFFFLLLQIYSQKSNIQNQIPFNIQTNRYEYSEVVNLSDQKANEIFRKAYSWSLNKFGSSQFLDSLNHSVFQKGSFLVNPSMRISGIDIVFDYDILFDVRISARYGRYKYEFFNIKMSSASEGMGNDLSINAFIAQGENYPKLGGKKFIKLTNETLVLIDNEFNNLIIEMKQQIDNSKINEW